METAQEMTNEVLALGQLKKHLEEAGIGVDNLVVVMVNDEQFVGEDDGLSPRGFDKFHLRLKSPKRLLRIQEIQPGNFKVDFLLIDLDLLDEACAIEVHGQGLYRVVEQSRMAQLRILNLFMQYLEGKKVQRARRAGIVAPPRGMMPPGGLGGVRP